MDYVGNMSWKPNSNYKSVDSVGAREFRTLRRLRAKSNLLKRFNLFLPVQSWLKKFSVLLVGQITITESRRPASQEGRFAIVTNVERGMRWTRGSAADERACLADGEAVWS
jgi:hypothetical protein